MGKKGMVVIAGSAAFFCCRLFFGVGAWGILALRGWIALVFLGVLYLAARLDLHRREIDNRLQYLILLLGVLELALFERPGLYERLAGFMAISLPMLILNLMGTDAFGGGDIKLMGAGGFFLGIDLVLFAAVAAFGFAGLYCIFMLLTGRIKRRDRIPFGPFLALGLAAAVFIGETAVNCYNALF